MQGSRLEMLRQSRRELIWQHAGMRVRKKGYGILKRNMVLFGSQALGEFYLLRV